MVSTGYSATFSARLSLAASLLAAAAAETEAHGLVLRGLQDVDTYRLPPS